ncbi:putative DNA-directed RNA polymerases I and III subunit RPAC1 [Paratrimastix pyriformis]|uniref:DNA-directed RNA polymerases I and III subunit RPAC1 n=1 Tax=Paratrimastix pyriformis TaxID=342808 RepID=A0ABQ8UMP2_9EUKA|nr:putative DNA-directed RNA polymerases I and III subunit RPAC1 [Paratrimastix pyriformis]
MEKKLPAHLEEQRRFVHVGEEFPSDATTLSGADTFQTLGVTQHWDLKEFQEHFKFEILRLTPDEIQFDLIGIDPAIANAFRRILIAEIPTVAIETVYVENNTSVVQDEVLANRLGLIPILVNPALLQDRKPGDAPTDQDTIVFKLNVKCTRRPGIPEDSANEEKFVNSSVYSGQLQWIPFGDQQARFGECPPRPVHHDILIAKMRPPQAMELQCFAIRGIGKDHAKFSPVATASYRLMPRVRLAKPVEGPAAESLKEACPLGVFDIEDGHAFVKNERNCSMCRECIRSVWRDRLGAEESAKLKDAVSLGRIKDHFIFTVESSGILSPETLFKQALEILMAKLERIEGDLLQL